jgi:hypothetical protein
MNRDHVTNVGASAESTARMLLRKILEAAKVRGDIRRRYGVARTRGRSLTPKTIIKDNIKQKGGSVNGRMEL